VTDKFDEATDLEDPGLESTGKGLVRAQEALVIHELQQVLTRQAERDVIINDMRAVIASLIAGHTVMAEQVKRLQHVCDVLTRQQADVNEREAVISSVLSSYAEKLERLAHEVGDRD